MWMGIVQGAYIIDRASAIEVCYQYHDAWSAHIHTQCHDNVHNPQLAALLTLIYYDRDKDNLSNSLLDYK